MSNTQRTIEVDGQTMVVKHKFEDAGLGLAPFRLIDVVKKVYVACQGAPVQPGSTCDFCGTAIMYEFWIASADGKRFKVGCDCVSRTGDMKLIAVAQAKENERKRELRKAGEAVRIADAMERVHEPAMREALTGLPHPLTWKAAQGATRLDWAEWMLQNSGNKGRMEVARYFDKVEVGAVDQDAERKAAHDRIELMKGMNLSAYEIVVQIFRDCPRNLAGEERDIWLIHEVSLALARAMWDVDATPRKAKS